MKTLKILFRRWSCEHDQTVLISRIHGDAINHLNYREERRCLKCGKTVYKKTITEERKILSFDAETNGLWGKTFAIGALVYDESGAEIARFVGRCPIDGPVNNWMEKNVLPHMTAIPVTHESYDALLADFAKFYMVNKADADVIVHMGVPVEAGLLRDMHDRKLIGDFDGPYPLIDLAGNLQQAGEDPTSVDGYVKKHGLTVVEFEGGTHNPLYDSAVAAVVYRHLRK